MAVTTGRGAGTGDMVEAQPQQTSYRQLSRQQRKQFRPELKPYNQRIRRIKQRGQSGDISQDRMQNRLRRVRGQRNEAIQPLLGQGQAPAQGQPAPQADPVPQATGPAPDAQNVQENNIAANALFPGIRPFEPQNYEGSPLYQFQKQQGSKALEELYSARGLTGSGAEIEGNSQFLNQLGAQEAARAQGISQQEADRLERLQRDESNRLERRDDAGFNRRMQLMQQLIGQNPMQYAYDAVGQTAGLKRGKKKARANLLSQLYEQVTPNYSAGPTRPNYIAPFGGPPSTAGIDAAQSVSGGSSNSDILGGALDFLGGFL